MKAIKSVVTWRRVEKPDWYEDGIGPEHMPHEEFWAPEGKKWPLAVLALYTVGPDGGVKPSFAWKLGAKDWFMEPDSAGSGLPPQLARRLGEILVEYAEKNS